MVTRRRRQRNFVKIEAVAGSPGGLRGGSGGGDGVGVHGRWK